VAVSELTRNRSFRKFMPVSTESAESAHLQIDSEETTLDQMLTIRAAAMESYRKRHVIFAEGAADALYLVIEGMVVEIEAAVDRRKVFAQIYGPNEFFGWNALAAGNAKRATSAVTLGKTTKVAQWPACDIRERVAEDASFATAVVNTLLRQDALGKEWAAGMMFRCLSGAKLAWTLYCFGERFGERNRDGSVTLPPISHEMLARTIGSTREIATLKMTALRKANLINYSRRAITLLHPERLPGFELESKGKGRTRQKRS
jgi:CRP-like cAMP-binding protein